MFLLREKLTSKNFYKCIANIKFGNTTKNEIAKDAVF